MTQQLIPLASMVAQSAMTPQKREARTKLIDATKMLNEIGWGNQGDIDGIEESVPMRELWVNPLSPLRYSDADIAQMTGSLQAQGQLQAITVAYVDDPGVDADGVPRGHLLIVDGALRFLGASGADFETMRVVVKPFHSMAEVMLEFSTTKLSQRTIDGWERGMLILRSRLTYEREREMFAARGEDHPMKRFYTQQELAKRWGCAQSTIHNWLELASQPMAILALLDEEKLNETQVMALIQEPDEAAKIAYAKKLARRNARKHVSAKQVDAETKRRTDKPKRAKPIILNAQPLPFDLLWSTHITEDTATVFALGCLLHDTRELLEIMQRDGKYPHATLARLAAVLGDPTIAQFVQEIEASA